MESHGTAPLLPTGVPNLDLILGGGLPANALVLVMGRPGSGKTTIANQIAFHAAATQGKRILILTALSEPTNKLIEHLRSFAFFDQSLVGGAIQFFSLQQVLPRGLEVAGREVLAMAREHSADIVVLDGFRGMRGAEGAPIAAREFLYEVGTALSALGSMFLVTSETDPRDSTFYPETTTADVILGLHYDVVDVSQQRALEVVKARGRAPLAGLHGLTLNAAGASIFPQFEVRIIHELAGGANHHLAVQDTSVTESISGQGRPLPTDPKGTPSQSERATFDLPVLDELTRGGLTRPTATLLAGSSGTGKTLLALYFALAGVRRGEPVLYVGLRENLDQIIAKADAFNMGRELRAALEPGGRLTLLRLPPIQLNPDIVAERILSEIDRLGARRLVVDSIYEVERAIRVGAHPQRLDDYLSALVETLHQRQVTAIFTKETEKALAATLDFSGEPLSVLSENVILLQQVAYQRHLYRVLSVLKMRLSDHDYSLREFRISAPTGIEVLGDGESQDGILRGIAQQSSAESEGIAGAVNRALTLNGASKGGSFPRRQRRAPRTAESEGAK